MVKKLWQNFNWMKVMKIAVGSTVAVMLASGLGLAYGTSAGVITLLSVQNTKKETLAVGGKRVAAFLIALGAAAFSFGLFGYGPLSLGCFLLLFAGICHVLPFQDAIAINTVLVTHFYVEQSMSLAWIQNEALLLLIGAGTGLLMNLYIPGNVTAIRKDQEGIEEDMRKILERMSRALLVESKRAYDGTCFQALETRLKEAAKKAEINRENNLLSDTRYYLDYMRMRKNQSHVLKKIYEDICMLDKVPGQTYPVSEFIRQIFDSFHEYNNAMGLLDRLDEIKAGMKEEPLPVTRSEFENRAVLYRILYELEEFLELKREFVMGLEEKQVKRYWKI